MRTVWSMESSGFVHSLHPEGLIVCQLQAINPAAYTIWTTRAWPSLLQVTVPWHHRHVIVSE